MTNIYVYIYIFLSIARRIGWQGTYFLCLVAGSDPKDSTDLVPADTWNRPTMHVKMKICLDSSGKSEPFRTKDPSLLRSGSVQHRRSLYAIQSIRSSLCTPCQSQLHLSGSSASISHLGHHPRRSGAVVGSRTQTILCRQGFGEGNSPPPSPLNGPTAAKGTYRHIFKHVNSVSNKGSPTDNPGPLRRCR
jgi:hypothetical protein